MNISEVTIGLAFLAGLASFLSPCVFSLVPAYVGYLSGRAAGGENTASNRWITFTHGLAFVLGFSVVFVVLGVAASAAGGLLFDVRNWLAKIGGVVIIIFGLHMIGVFRIPFLEYDARVHELPDPKLGYLSSASDGCVFLSRMVAVCRPGVRHDPDICDQRRFGCAWREIAFIIFCRARHSVSCRGIGHWLGDNDFAKI